MRMTFNVWVDGDAALVAELEQARFGVGFRAGAVVRQTAADVVSAAQQLVPIRRGQLYDSITFDMLDILSAEIGPENRLGGGYGHIVEKGDAHRAPHPFLEPALDSREAAFETAMVAASRGLLP